MSYTLGDIVDWQFLNDEEILEAFRPHELVLDREDKYPKNVFYRNTLVGTVNEDHDERLRVVFNRKFYDMNNYAGLRSKALHLGEIMSFHYNDFTLEKESLSEPKSFTVKNYRNKFTGRVKLVEGLYVFVKPKIAPSDYDELTPFQMTRVTEICNIMNKHMRKSQ